MKEVWKDVNGHEGLYQVSDLGRVKSLSRERWTYKNKYHGKIKERILKSCIDKHGYPVVVLCNGKCKSYKIHQLVAESFLNHIRCGYKLVVDHKDFNKANNRLSNLRLITQRENTNQKNRKSSSAYTGVSWYNPSKKWVSFIRVKGKKKYLGYFNNEMAAAIAYQNELRKLNKN